MKKRIVLERWQDWRRISIRIFREVIKYNLKSNNFLELHVSESFWKEMSGQTEIPYFKKGNKKKFFNLNLYVTDQKEDVILVYMV